MVRDHQRTYDERRVREAGLQVSDLLVWQVALAWRDRLLSTFNIIGERVCLMKNFSRVSRPAMHVPQSVITAQYGVYRSRMLKAWHVV